MEKGTQYTIIAYVIVLTLVSGGFWLFSHNSWDGWEGITGAANTEGADAGHTAASAVAFVPRQTAETETAADLTIRYTDGGFAPQTAELTVGQSVRFVNESDFALFLVSKKYSPDTDAHISGFQTSKSLGQGESYEVSVTQAGVWTYHNLNHSEHIGTLIINEQ